MPSVDGIRRGCTQTLSTTARSGAAEGENGEAARDDAEEPPPEDMEEPGTPSGGEEPEECGRAEPMDVGTAEDRGGSARARVGQRRAKPSGSEPIKRGRKGEDKTGTRQLSGVERWLRDSAAAQKEATDTTAKGTVEQDAAAAALTLDPG